MSGIGVTRPSPGGAALLLLTLLAAAAPGAAIKGPPVLSQRVSPHLVVQLGNDVRLSCPVTGTPAPMMEWRKDGAQIHDSWQRFSIHANTLRVSRVTADDAGVYVCVAVNGFGTKRVTTELFVIDPNASGHFDQLSGGRDTADNLVTSRGRPPVILLPKQGSTLQGPVGSRLQISCVTSGYPEPEVKWYKKGHAVLPSTRVQVGGGQLVFTRLVESDADVYICVAANVFGSANHSLTLRTTEPVSPDPVFLGAPTNTTVYEGDTAVMQCRVQSISKAHIKWVRKIGPSAGPALNQTLVEIQGVRYAVISGAHTVQDGHSYFTKLTLRSVVPSQEGVYVCMAANDNGFAGREAFLHVAPAPPDSMQALLIALPAVAVVGFVLGAICCLHRRRKTLPPPSDNKHKQYAPSLPPGGARPNYVTQRYAADGDRAVRTVLMPPGQLCVDGGSLSRTHVPPPAPYDYRQFRHLDVV
ncbi:fibroblast growth factor receptor-like 1 [Pollicipes pollicipes]|uniref:fibroblast growth factor receptor-like 1 n=1 Tax=Pollicipes pollicipes TaxID=41117 RepID=UPI001884FF50|nr:fibroblast growth factor receptor-like 1 [Pollicipes pollicipes]XP_037092028.1 fibroblast growth factor receptor-like 1 [Pollicipes pollicipes]